MPIPTLPHRSRVQSLDNCVWNETAYENIGQQTRLTNADRLGIFASVLCFAHCVLAPMAVSLLPVAAHYVPSEEKIHRYLAVSAALSGALAIFFGYRRHRRFRVAVFIGAGLILICGGAFGGGHLPSHLAEVAVTTAGSCLMIAGHFLNHTFCRDCDRCDRPALASCESCDPKCSQTQP
jgi:MerC mercury resistance protein